MATGLNIVHDANSETRSLSALSMMLAGALGASLGMGQFIRYSLIQVSIAHCPIPLPPKRLWMLIA